MDILQNLKNFDSLDLSPSHFTIKAMWKFQGRSYIDSLTEISSPPSEYAFILTLTNGGVGCCYCDDKFEFYCDKNWIGHDARKITPSERTIEISILDSIYSNLPKIPTREVVLDGSPAIKAVERAKLLVSEIEFLAKEKNITNPVILNIGALERLVSELSSRNTTIYATDLHPSMIGNVVRGVEIMNGENNKSLIKKSDIVVVTGMTIVNNTLNDILDLCKEQGKTVIIYALTGANFGWQYCKMGVDVVVSEFFPFYTIPGQTKIKIFHK